MMGYSGINVSRWSIFLLLLVVDKFKSSCQLLARKLVSRLPAQANLNAHKFQLATAALNVQTKPRGSIQAICISLCDKPVSKNRYLNKFVRLLETLLTLSNCIMSDDKSATDAGTIAMPQKRYFRQRAHINPVADHASITYPLSPEETDWSQHYKLNPGDTAKIRYLDVGCGFGGLLVALSPKLDPSELALGMEIRGKVSTYVQQRILALRSQNAGSYGNIWCIRTNAMRYIPNYIPKGQLHKMFFLFPDPHFKKTKYKWRIINDALLAEYAYVCALGAIIYIATDVEDLFDWMSEHLTRHPLFEPLPETELNDDEMIKLITTTTEEGKKVERNEGDKFFGAFRRVAGAKESQ